MSEIRRKLLIQSGESLAPIDYIQDGLIFNLDGTDKGNSPDNWTDKVSGVVFTCGSAVEELSNGFKFIQSNNSYIVANQNLSFTSADSANYTIEAVFNSTNPSNTWGLIFAAGNTNTSRGTGIAVSTQYNSKYIWFNNRQSASYRLDIPNISLQTVSIQYKDKTFYRNGIKIVSTNTNTSSFGHEYYPGIGNRYSQNYGQWNSAGHFIGSIHAIRVYNRKLTEAEILHNQ